MRRLLRAGKRLYRRIVPARPGPTILCYHRVASPVVDPWRLAVSPENFSGQLAALRAERTILPMEEFVERLRRRRLPAGAVALTFDDGYRDNLLNAAPRLTEFEIPATLFLATGLLGTRREYWWDELARLVLLCSAGAESDIRIGKNTIPVRIEATSRPTDATAGWLAWNRAPTPAAASYVALWKAMRQLPTAEIDGALHQVRTAVGDVAAVEEEALPMTVDEVRLLPAEFVLQAHTATHPDMLAIDARDCRDEIARGRDQLAAITGQRPSGFAFPYGREDRNIRAMVSEAGFAWACSTRSAAVRLGEPDLFELPRRAVPNVDGAGLLRFLHH